MNLTPMRCWAEIDLDALRENIMNIRARLSPDTRVMAVVKADAYGHGSLPVSRALLSAGVEELAVATLGEGIFLREHGITCPILLLGTPLSSDAGELVRYDLSSCVTDTVVPAALSRAAAAQGKTASVHIKADTGMNRLGFLSREEDGSLSRAVGEIRAIASLPSLRIDGIFTHFAKADEREGGAYTRLQFARFMRLVDALEAENIRIPKKHAANSAAIMDYPEFQLDMVRPGIILYGCYPSEEVDKSHLSVRPVMTFKSVITHIKTLSEGEAISYGGTFQTAGKCRIATVSVGYADGWNRRLSGRVRVSVRGQTVPVVGRICMDQCMIDVTSVQNTVVGDEVILFGDGAQSVTLQAETLGTISYELLCGISKRVPRVYIEGGVPVGIAEPVSFMA